MVGAKLLCRLGKGQAVGPKRISRVSTNAEGAVVLVVSVAGHWTRLAVYFTELCGRNIHLDHR